ncbi:hypothetical protein PoB_002371100 [Plakobranchus ocellatus]|uniref:Uncharacterized protein n=1 Tax=Plakobranchus ocellatus TaxID=259542 RepID=A0AAV3ZD73_9GAST|nr:hypothetical protein PoB_002371100 [Plakobranchus ocellatus]
MTCAHDNIVDTQDDSSWPTTLCLGQFSYTPTHPAPLGPGLLPRIAHTDDLSHGSKPTQIKLAFGFVLAVIRSGKIQLTARRNPLQMCSDIRGRKKKLTARRNPLQMCSDIRGRKKKLLEVDDHDEHHDEDDDNEEKEEKEDVEMEAEEEEGVEK